MRLPPVSRTVVLALLTLLTLSAFGCAAPAPTTAPTSSAPLPTSSSIAPTSPSAPGTGTVELSGFSFQPATLRVKAGARVQYANKDSVTHTVTNGQNGVADSHAAFDQSVAAGATVTVTFDKVGTVRVTCKIHPTMNQTVEVSP